MCNVYQEDESISSKLDKLNAIQRQISEEPDTVSEISHTLTHDDPYGGKGDKFTKIDVISGNILAENVQTGADNTCENDKTAIAAAVVHAQDAIAKKQKEHFDNMINCLDGD